jgi:hypothetical protein
MNRPHSTYELHGNPQMLSHVPSPKLLREAGAGKTAKAIERAIELRNRCSEAKAAMLSAEREVRQAAQVDRAEHARTVARSPNAKLEPTNAERAERELADAKRRYEALCTAVETAADELFETGGADADKVAEAARTVRERSVARVERAAQEVAQAVDELQAALGVAAWSAQPSSRKWRVALGTATIGRRHGGIPIAQVVEALRELPAILEAQQLPAERTEEPTITFGWSGIGAGQTRPGSVRTT